MIRTTMILRCIVLSFSFALSLVGGSNITQLSDNNASEWTYQTLDQTKYPLARCLDGTQGAYLLKLGDVYPERVLVYLQGGRWCSDISLEKAHMHSNCINRSKKYLGSTNLNYRDIESYKKENAFFDDDPTTNPAFYGWTYVFVRYCDGASFSGLRRKPIIVSDGTQLYSQGNHILKAVVKSLFTKKNVSPLTESTTVVLSGGSAGALGVYLHAHQLRQWLPTTMQVAAIPDSGFFREWNGAGSLSESYANMMRSVYRISMPRKGLPTECFAAQEDKSKYYRCMFANNVASYIPVPFFFLNSRFDSFQVTKILGYTGIPSSSGLTLTDVNIFGDTLGQQIQNAFEKQDPYGDLGSGIFLHSCNNHNLNDKEYTSCNVGGVTANEAIREWVDKLIDSSASGASTGNSSQPVTYVSDDLFPCDHCCDINW